MAAWLSDTARSHGHGGFMADGPAILASPLWSRILQTLLPEFYDQAQQRHASGGNVISMFENNPVCAAFGLCSLHEAGRALVPVEWDVYVDKQLCNTWSGQENEDELIDKVLHTMLIAHGGLGALLAEAVGLPCAYRMVRATDIATLGGFVFVEWMRIFNHALDLFEQSHPPPPHPTKPAADRSHQSTTATASNPESSAASSSPNPPPVHPPKSTDPTTDSLGAQIASSAVAAHKRLFGAPLRVFLDLKSSLANPRLWTLLIRALNRHGIVVYSVGHFVWPQLCLPSEQRVCGERHAGPLAIRLAHTFGDVMHAFGRGELRAGHCLMFNGGSMLASHALHLQDRAARAYGLQPGLLAALDTLLCHGIQVGIYVQETALDERAARLLAYLANEGYLPLGFAWGATTLHGLCAPPVTRIGPPRFGLQWSPALTGIGWQGWIGRAWDGTVRAGEAAHPKSE